MSLPERAIYSMTRMVLASRASRNIFAAYCVALHILVFLSMYWMSTAEVDRAAHLESAAAGVASLGSPMDGAPKDATK